ncbi:MAG: putative [LysW]-aminoadipate/[LysW]-glutamate kinase [Nitrosopumilales archaeon]|nr:MAG: putative [LysW]-aminoadipate/[LysW]-glutamate kinase [Nitrosopumilales archaeon]
MITIKIGGSIVDNLHPTTIADIKKVSQQGVILVHGGAKQVTQISEALGKKQKFIVSPSGIKSRFTDQETVEIFTMVMSGKINKTIVRMLQKNGINAVGLSGIDGQILQADRKKKLIVVNEKGRKMAIDGGYTGKIREVNASLIKSILDQGYTPVISPVAISEEYDFLNVDGDRAAAYVAGKVKADRILFLTNVDGLLMDNKLVKNLSLSEAKEMLPKIGHGMEKKVLAATESLEMGVNEALIANGQKENPISSALSHDNCTVITK